MLVEDPFNTYILADHCLHRTIRGMRRPVHHQMKLPHLSLLDFKDHLDDWDALDISLQEQSD